MPEGVDNFHRTYGSLRLRYFGPRALIEDNSVRSKATTLLNFEGGYRVVKNLRANLTGDIYNLLDAEVSDIDYYFASRLQGEPAGRRGGHPRPSGRPPHAACRAHTFFLGLRLECGALRSSVPPRPTSSALFTF